MGLNWSVGGDAEVCVQILDSEFKPVGVNIIPDDNNLVLR